MNTHAYRHLARLIYTRPWTPRAIRCCVLCGHALPDGKVGRGPNPALYCDRVECRRAVSRESSRRDYQRHPARYKAHAAAATARALSTEAGRERIRARKRAWKRRRLGITPERAAQLDEARAAGRHGASEAPRQGGQDHEPC